MQYITNLGTKFAAEENVKKSSSESMEVDSDEELMGE